MPAVRRVISLCTALPSAASEVGALGHKVPAPRAGERACCVGFSDELASAPRVACVCDVLHERGDNEAKLTKFRLQLLPHQLSSAHAATMRHARESRSP